MRKLRSATARRLCAIALAVILLAACGPRWEVVVVGPDGAPYQVTVASLESHRIKGEAADSGAGSPRPIRTTAPSAWCAP